MPHFYAKAPTQAFGIALAAKKADRCALALSKKQVKRVCRYACVAIGELTFCMARPPAGEISGLDWWEERRSRRIWSDLPHYQILEGVRNSRLAKDIYV